MDRKTILIVGVCFGLLLLWPQLVRKAFPPTKLPPGATNQAAKVTQVRTVTNSAGVVTNIIAEIAAAPSVSATSAVARAVGAIAALDTNAPEQLLVVTNADVRYTFTSHGGGLKLVELLRYPETVSPLRKKKATVAAQDVATLNDGMALPVGALLDDGTTAGDGVYQLTATATGARAEKLLASGLSVVKEFVVSTNYLVTAAVRVENRGAAAVALPAREVVVGSATPLGEHDNGSMVGVMWYNGEKVDQTVTPAWFANQSFMSCVTRRASVPHTEYRGGSNNVAWAAAHNQFFAWAAIPETPVTELVVRPVPLPREAGTPKEIPNPQGYQTSLAYPAVTLAPGEAVEQKINIFAGPKEYRTLAAIGERFKNNVDLVMGVDLVFPFYKMGGFFSKMLLLAMNGVHSIGLTYGWSIILITFIVKMVFWPLTAASTRSMKRMSVLQPQMKAIQAKYKDDPAKMNRKTMEFMKEHKINPLGGCLPMLVQMPIFIGFYGMIRTAIELRGAQFLWIGDLSNPDTLFIIPGLSFIPFFGIPGVGLPVNLLPLIMVGSQIWQAHLMPPSPGMDPAQQKMMRYMPLMILLFMYNLSAGLTLYWTVSNLLSILQTKLTKTDPNDPLLALHPKKGK